MKNQEETSWAEIRAMIKENAKQFTKDHKELTKKLKQLSESQKETDRMIKENAKLINGISASNGEFCEEYFVNSFKANPTLAKT